MPKKAVLIILDGYGLAPDSEGNAIARAKKPNLDRLFSQNPCSRLSASGLDVPRWDTPTSARAGSCSRFFPR